MSDQEPVPGEDDDVEVRDPDDPGEVPTRFSTIGRGWSGRDQEDDES
jgi:hypothetical protein